MVLSIGIETHNNKRDRRENIALADPPDSKGGGGLVP